MSYVADSEAVAGEASSVTKGYLQIPALEPSNLTEGIIGILAGTDVLLDYEAQYWATIHDARRLWLQDEVSLSSASTGFELERNQTGLSHLLHLSMWRYIAWTVQ